MKAFKKTSEIIEYVRIFHTKMRKFYEQLNKNTETERVKMYLDFLISHEKLSEETLADFLNNSSSDILNSWIKFVPESLHDDCFKNAIPDPEITIDDIVKHALNFNNCLIEMYKGLIEEADAEEVKNAFDSLLKKNVKEEKNLVRDAELLNDL